ncbi:hypothetical protein BG006_007378 [Podila minutissima]|uniref:Uncharacterized protein n=1 Tax=Podila minutissima TaxID=64525 RepID=A0A9P5SHD8_9FUNG|nr:hypothetical protein BG006_007378 [Podila minutissima]
MSSSTRILTSISILSSLALLVHLLTSCAPYIEPLVYRCLLPRSLTPQDTHTRFPLLDRLTCALAAFYTDAHASPLGLLSLQLILNVFVSTVFLAHVEGSRRGAAWTLLACTPLAGFICTAVGGIGVYVPLMLVPLLIHHKATIESSPRANAVPLPRVYALLVALVINVAIQILAFVYPHDASFLGRAVAGQVLYSHLAWFLYTPLTVVFEKAILALVLTEQQQDLRARQVLLRVFYLLAGLNAGVHVASVLAFWHSGTSTRQVAQVFGYQFRAEHAEAASAYYLLWDMVGAAWGSLLWIVADAGSWWAAVLILALAPVVSPVAAMMVYAARREDRFLERFSTRRYDGKAKLQ